MSTNPQYQPFRGCSAWFSCSVQPDIIKQWGEYGGKYAGREVADFLFSESPTTNDTKLIYNQNSCAVSVFRPEWITAVIEEECPATSISIAQYILLPDYCTPLYDQNTMTTPPRRPPISQPHFSNKTSRVSLTSNETAIRNRYSEIETKYSDTQHQKEKPKTTEKLNFHTLTNPSSHDTRQPVEAFIKQEQLNDIVHIDTLGPITERLIDFVPSQNGLTVQRRMNNK